MDLRWSTAGGIAEATGDPFPVSDCASIIPHLEDIFNTFLALFVNFFVGE